MMKYIIMLYNIMYCALVLQLLGYAKLPLNTFYMSYKELTKNPE